VGVRRVVTGHDQEGRAVFVSDDQVEPTTVRLSAASYHEFWRADAPPTFPDGGVNGPKTTFFPPQGGFRFFVLTLPPGDPNPSGDIDLEAGFREMEERLPGVTDWFEADNPGMHRTDTVDMLLVISGEITLELDDGVERTLGPGDVVIQNGTRHRWHNRGTEPVVMACALVGASRA
jgi:mannose-6-phosphate isomerase-like protein (cupin superfamily)